MTHGQISVPAVASFTKPKHLKKVLEVSGSSHLGGGALRGSCSNERKEKNAQSNA